LLFVSHNSIYGDDRCREVVIADQWAGSSIHLHSAARESCKGVGVVVLKYSVTDTLALTVGWVSDNEDVGDVG
jgi:hypothetical protein